MASFTRKATQQRSVKNGVLSLVLLGLFLLPIPINCPAHALEDQQDYSNDLGYSGVQTKGLHRRYLAEARRYRSQGRYELARQSYLLALSIAPREKEVSIIRKELEGLELLLRTLR